MNTQVIIFYRGILVTLLCRQLADYQAHIDQFKEENVDIIALSVDP